MPTSGGCQPPPPPPPALTYGVTTGAAGLPLSFVLGRVSPAVHAPGDPPAPSHLCSPPRAPHPQVAGTTLQLQVGLEQHLGRLGEVLAPRADYLQTLKFLQQLAGSVVLQLSGLPVWRGVSADLTALAARAAYVEYYR